MRSLALVISFILHPVFMLSYISSYFLFTQNYFSYFMSPAKKIFLMAAVIIFSVILPLLNVALLKKLGYIRSITVNSSEERFMPYVSSLVLHIGLLYIIHDLEIPFFFKYMIISSVAVLIALFIVNIFSRISAHAAGLGGCLGILFFYNFISYAPALLPMCICILLCGLAGFARMYLHAHTPKQLYGGFFTGLVAGVLSLVLMLYFNFQF